MEKNQKLVKLSMTSVNRFLSCSYCYFLHYEKGVRLKKTKSALVFGGTLDESLNHLLINKNLKEAKELFGKKWFEVQKKNVQYSKSDVDEELVNYFNPLTKDHFEWSTLYYKGLMFIETYYNEVLPKFKRILAVQEPISIKNSEGDEIKGFLDLVVELQDGRMFLLDNKSSSIKYEENSAKEGSQLPLYDFAVKDKYNLDGIGYIVLNKKINKNRKKVCKSCGTLNESSHKKCPVSYDQPVMNGEDIKVKSHRCGGDFEITINPKVDIQYIFNEVEESDIDRVIKDFDYVNHQVTHGIYATEHNPVRGKFGWCDYKDYFENSPDFYILEKKK